MESVAPADAIGRMRADKELSLAMGKAHQVASLAIGLDFGCEEVQSHLEQILLNLQELLPRTHQRIYLSYAWLMLCTQMVNYSHHKSCIIN